MQSCLVCWYVLEFLVCSKVVVVGLSSFRSNLVFCASDLDNDNGWFCNNFSPSLLYWRDVSLDCCIGGMHLTIH